MASLFDASKLFNKDEWSDITIICGEKKVKCHKVILCTTSDYFAKQFGPDSQFAESQRREVTLEEDDPSAVEALLRYIYTSNYQDDSDIWNTWLAHFEVYKVARKYLVPKLAKKALVKVVDMASGLTAGSDIAEVVLKIEDEADGNTLCLQKVLIVEHFLRLRQVDKFKMRVTDDSEFAWKCLDLLSEELHQWRPK